jgi:hypothetical protein
MFCYPNGNPNTPPTGSKPPTKPMRSSAPYSFMDRLPCNTCTIPHNIHETQSVQCKIHIGLDSIRDLIRTGCHDHKPRGTPAGQHATIIDTPHNGRHGQYRGQRPHDWIK